MHENAITTIGEEEGHGFILSVGFGALGVGHHDLYLLPHLIECTKRLTTSVDTFAWSNGQHGIDAARVVGTAFDKRERQQFHLRRVVVDDMTCLRHHLAVLILQHQAPRIFLNLNAAIFRLVCNGFPIANTLPSRRGRHRTRQHHALAVAARSLDG